MKTAKLLNNLQQISKSYFSFADLRKIYSGQPENLKVIVYRLIKQQKIFRLQKGYYALNLAQVDWEQLACEILQPSYISFEYALHYYELLDQIPARVTLATTKKNRELILTNQVFEYSHLNSKLYFGYKIQGNFLIAEKEKALLDEIYLISLKKRHLPLESLQINKINKKLFLDWSKKFPSYTQKLAKKICAR